MIFSQLALSFVLTAGSTMAAFATPPPRKFSKKKAALAPKRWTVTGTNSIQGTYMYTNKCNNVFQATIECDRFGDSDPDLCMFSEYTIGDIVTDCDDDEVSAGICVALADRNGFVKANDKLPVDGSILDKDTICEFSGTFRASSAMDGNMVKPIPLASSNGCPTTTTNFKLVVQGIVTEDGNLELEFSDNFGQSYYTNEKVCPKSYIGLKVSDDIVDQGRALAYGGDGNDALFLFFQFVVKLAICVWDENLCWGNPVPTPVEEDKLVPTPAPSPDNVYAWKNPICGGAVNPSGDKQRECQTNLWIPTDDATMHCFAYGDDPCHVSDEDPNYGRDKDPSLCLEDTFYLYTFYLWDEEEKIQQGAFSWAGRTWLEYSRRFATELRAMKARGTKVTSPMLQVRGPLRARQNLQEFFVACGPACFDPDDPAYIDIIAINASCSNGDYNGVSWAGQCPSDANFAYNEALATSKAFGNLPVYITSWSRLETWGNPLKQLEAIEAIDAFFPSTNSNNRIVQRVYWLGATVRNNLSGGSSNVLTTVLNDGTSLGEHWRSKCDSLCVSGGNLCLDNPVPTPVEEICGCRTASCTYAILNTEAGDSTYTCREEMDYQQTAWGYSDREACAIVAGDYYPSECGGCDPDRCMLK